MKVAYLDSLYPAPSHTFIQREILELEKLGVDIIRFSVRQPGEEDLLDDLARSEARQTRSLLPIGPGIVPALLWVLATHPLRAVTTLWLGLRSARDMFAILKWCAYFVEAIQLAHWLEKDGVKHLHCHFGNAGSNTAWLASKLGAIGLSITFHGIDLDEPDRFRHREKLADASFAVCISNFGKGLLVKNLAPEDVGKVAIVRCGFPVPNEANVPEAPGRGRIISVARLSQEKGHKVLLEALGTLVAEGIPFHCTLVGAGPLQGELRAMVSRLNLDRHVTMAGAVPNDRVVEMIASSDLSVLASFGEGIPIALLESLAWKRPFVASRVGGIPELAPAETAGLLVEPGDPVALANGLKRLILDRELATKLAETGRKHVAAQHNPTLAANQMLRLFQEAEKLRQL